MISFSFSRYRLQTPAAKHHEGALLRFQFADGSVGYGDCFPWDEFGDASLAFHLEELIQGRLTTLTRQSLLCAERDAQFRGRKLNMLSLLPRFKNHFLVTDLVHFESLDLHRALRQGFETFKIKVGKDLAAEANKIHELFSDVRARLRLDFNSKSTLDTFAKFTKDIGESVTSKIEFVEDPFPFDALSWHQASQLLPLAIDHEIKNVNFTELEQIPFSVMIIKPARQNVEKILDKCLNHKLKCVVTSSLDHPLAVISAAIVAGELKRDYPDLVLDSGCLSFHAYQPDEFSKCLHLNGPFIEGVEGSGLGFDSVLEKIHWESSGSHVQTLINPKLSSEEQQRLTMLAEYFPQPDGVWIASSGSSNHLENSVKFVALSEKALKASAKSVNRHLKATSKDVWAQVLPEFHVGGLGIQYRAELSGARVVSALLLNINGGKWDPAYFVKVCDEQKVTLASLVPTQVFDLVSLGVPVPASLRAILVGGAALTEELYLHARKVGWPVLPSYGMTEAASTVAVAPLNSLIEKLTYPDFQVLSHLKVTINSESLIEIEGESLLTGFAQWSEGRPQWFSPLSGDGILRTQDLGELTVHGLRVLGRQGDFIKILGEGVNLSRLRGVLEQLGCAETYLLDSPDDRRGAELSLVFENAVPVQDRRRVFETFNQLVAPFERLQRIQIVDQIPRSSLGKVLRTELLLRLEKNRSL